jgi:tRNA(Ile)-lysidine synthase TilS/MesJ
MNICKKCIIPDTFPNVTFENGVCSVCNNHQHTKKMNINYLGKDKFVEVLNSKKGTEYDCAVPSSGGKDSSYVLYYIAKELKLKPLAIFFDNGFTTDYALENIKNICEKLDVDLVVGHSTEYRDKFIRETLYLSKYLGRMLPLCSNCETNLRSFAINEATTRDIPFIIWGSTDFEDGEETFVDSESETFRQSYGKIGNTFKKISGSVQMIVSGGSFLNKIKAMGHATKFIYYIIRDNIKMQVPEGMKKFIPFSEVSFEGKGIQTLYFYDYIPYNPFEFIKKLEQEIGWKAPEGKEGKMDCRLAFWKDYEKVKKTGLSGTGFTLSVLVRDGKLSRDEALKKEELKKKDLKQECQRIGDDYNVELDGLL